MANVLVACEESQEVCKAFRKMGHNAFSCDILEPSGGHPEWHIKGDVLEVLKGGCFYTTDLAGELGATYHYVTEWDLIIAFPPCTFLTCTGNRWFDITRYGEKAVQRHIDRNKAIDFFMELVNADCAKIAIENPIGVMSTYYRKPDQIIHPYFFGHPERKSTCLWLKGLPILRSTDVVEPYIIQYKNGKGTDSYWHVSTMNKPKAERSRLRSKTFSGVASAMAEQWGCLL